MAIDPALNSRDPRLQVVCTTTLLGAIVQSIGGADVSVSTLIPFGACPGHFDLSPTEAHQLRDADLLLQHGFENFLARISSAERVQAVRVAGNWMTPEVHIHAVDRVAEILANLRPDHADAFQTRAAAYKANVRAAGESVQAEMEPFRGIPVVASSANRDLVEWLGLKVVKQFSRDENVSVRSLHEILITGRDRKALLVLDNRQSSGKTGRVIARELNVPVVMLTNFPDLSGPDPETPPYIYTLLTHTAHLREALNGM